VERGVRTLSLIQDIEAAGPAPDDVSEGGDSSPGADGGDDA
jgi:hypothetical protein